MKTRNELKTLRAKSKQELIKLLDKNYKQLNKYRFALSFKKLKNIKQIYNTKKTIARIWTIISENTIVAKKNN